MIAQLRKHVTVTQNKWRIVDQNFAQNFCDLSLWPFILAKSLLHLHSYNVYVQQNIVIHISLASLNHLLNQARASLWPVRA